MYSAKPASSQPSSDASTFSRSFLSPVNSTSGHPDGPSLSMISIVTLCFLSNFLNTLDPGSVASITTDASNTASAYLIDSNILNSKLSFTSPSKKELNLSSKSCPILAKPHCSKNSAVPSAIP